MDSQHCDKSHSPNTFRGNNHYLQCSNIEVQMSGNPPLEDNGHATLVTRYLWTSRDSRILNKLCIMMHSLTHGLLKDLQVSTWQSKDYVGVDSRFRRPACQYWSVHCLATSTKLSCSHQGCCADSYMEHA